MKKALGIALLTLPMFTMAGHKEDCAIAFELFDDSTKILISVTETVTEKGSKAIQDRTVTLNAFNKWSDTGYDPQLKALMAKSAQYPGVDKSNPIAIGNLSMIRLIQYYNAVHRYISYPDKEEIETLTSITKNLGENYQKLKAMCPEQ
ncbi:hypothetical protein EKN56_14120 [Limnobaculum zhutongyuii]|uniref:Uncharacterized protein n=1 Tax=Limnobaculum zhutongyuii TaxID=2498113 RepID=A0A411WMQ5_9GAMM|nr:hypothetical protein [Limnobaculum zhutongyuii]QBH97437.1 hypothetical protein EKN56_14120 [Limnobaculum zhutongyuii]TQS90912.1 hypothetical protein ELQ32_00845 [Limnobaculum zhutongyuii]